LGEDLSEVFTVELIRGSFRVLRFVKGFGLNLEPPEITENMFKGVVQTVIWHHLICKQERDAGNFNFACLQFAKNTRRSNTAD